MTMNVKMSEKKKGEPKLYAKPSLIGFGTLLFVDILLRDAPPPEPRACATDIDG